MSDKILLNFDDIRYTVKASVLDYSVEFEVFSITGVDAEGVRYYEDDLSDIDVSKPEITGQVKRDGCSNWDFSPDDVMIHGCSREDLVNIGTLLSRLWDFAKENLERFDG